MKTCIKHQEIQKNWTYLFLCCRYILFCQKKQRNEVLPPTSDSLSQHIKRANYQAYVWRNALEPMQQLPPLESHCLYKEDGVLKPVLITREQAPKSLLELTTCQCKISMCRTNCSCSSTGLPCTESCFCMGDEEACKNPHRIMLHYNSDSEDSDND